MRWDNGWGAVFRLPNSEERTHKKAGMYLAGKRREYEENEQQVSFKRFVLKVVSVFSQFLEGCFSFIPKIGGEMSMFFEMLLFSNCWVG